METQTAARAPGLTVGLPPLPSPVVAADMATIFAQLGVLSFRASVVDISSMVFLSGWAVSELGEISGETRADGPLDSVIPGAAATIGQLEHAQPGHAAVQRLSARRWLVVWRIDGRQVVVADARYREARSMVGDLDTALIRLLCQGALGQIRNSQQPIDLPAPVHTPELVFTQPEGPVLPWRAGLALAAAAALTGVWLAAVALPGARADAEQLAAQSSRLHMAANHAIVQGLSSALATGDYGEVQTSLSSFAALGYFESAAVTNLNQRVVALQGRVDGMRVGDVAAASVANPFLDLSAGGKPLGRLLILKSPPPSFELGSWAGLRITAALAVLAGLGLCGLFAVQWLRWKRATFS